MKTIGSEFDVRRVRRVQLVCKDIARTTTFYRDALGMQLVKTFDLPGGIGQRVVFDVGNGALLSFLWFPAVRATDSSASPSPEPGDGPRITAHGSIDYVRFEVSVERFNEYRRHMKDRGPPIVAGEAVSHKALRRSLYCLDPDGISLEFTCWTTSPAQPPQTAREPAPAKSAAARLAEPALDYA